jgi:hypothetical protein
MIGRNYPSYRPRRPLRRYYWALFGVVVFCLWQSGTVTRGKSAEPEVTSKPLTPRTSPETIEEIIKEESPLAADINARHVHHHKQDSPIPYIPASNADSTVVGDSASTSKLTTEDNTEQQELDGVERIGEHRDDDSVEHAAKLTHPDDDDGAMSDTELPAFHNDGQIRIVSTKDKNANVDDLLNADHLSKEQSELLEDEKDEESTPRNLKKEQHPIETLKEQTPWSEHYEFPSWSECQEIKEKADRLPDLLHVPFEVSVKDVVLEGWEDQWIAKARYLGPKLEEPKIDFVYNCKHLVSETTI